MITLQEIGHRDDFFRLEAEWRRLEAAGAAPTLFQSWPWQRAWLDHLGRGASLHTLVFTDWREVVGIAPLMIRRSYGLPLRRLQWIGTGVSDYLGPLIVPGYENSVLRAFTGYLSSRASRFWDVADLQQLREDSPLTQAVKETASLRTPHAALLPQAVAPYRPLPPTIEELNAGFGRKLRSNLRYALRVLEREHHVEFARATPDDLEREMTAFFHLHALRWRSRWQPGVLFGRAVQSFHREAARGLLEQDSLRLHSLRLDGATVASLYCFSYTGVGYYYLGGFDPALSRQSVGTLLTAHAQEDAVREGCREFDFLRGQEPYKYRWGCVNRTNCRWIQAGRGIWSAPSPALLRREQRLAEWYESHAHGGPEK